MAKLQDVRNALAECFKVNTQPLTKAQVLAWIGTNFRNANFNSNTLQAQLYRSCINVKASTTTAPKILWYDKSNRTYRAASPTDEVPQAADAAVGNDEEVEVDFEADTAFALEAHLRDYLARNLGTLEKGLQLWSDSPPSVEYVIGGRRIDLLAKDAEGIPVVIELKLSKSYDRVIGQALLYQGLVTRALGLSRVRIMLVAGEVSSELKIACASLSDVTLFEYAITMDTKKVSSTIEEGS